MTRTTTPKIGLQGKHKGKGWAKASRARGRSASGTTTPRISGGRGRRGSPSGARPTMSGTATTRLQGGRQFQKRLEPAGPAAAAAAATAQQTAEAGGQALGTARGPLTGGGCHRGGTHPKSCASRPGRQLARTSLSWPVRRGRCSSSHHQRTIPDAQTCGVLGDRPHAARCWTPAPIQRGDITKLFYHCGRTGHKGSVAACSSSRST